MMATTNQQSSTLAIAAFTAFAISFWVSHQRLNNREGNNRITSIHASITSSKKKFNSASAQINVETKNNKVKDPSPALQEKTQQTTATTSALKQESASEPTTKITANQSIPATKKEAKDKIIFNRQTRVKDPNSKKPMTPSLIKSPVASTARVARATPSSRSTASLSHQEQKETLSKTRIAFQPKPIAKAKPQRQRQRPRVRDSLLPEQIRQNNRHQNTILSPISQNKTNAPATATTSAKPSVSKEPVRKVMNHAIPEDSRPRRNLVASSRKKIRVRDSLLPESIKQKRKAALYRDDDSWMTINRLSQLKHNTD